MYESRNGGMGSRLTGSTGWVLVVILRQMCAEGRNADSVSQSGRLRMCSLCDMSARRSGKDDSS